MSAADVAAADLSAAGLLAVATGAAREAGELLARRAAACRVAATKSSPTDVVTEMDRRSEELIRARILAGAPGDAILGEEGGQTGDTAGAPVRWVIDPLDGTVNYLYGLPDWAVSIAAEVAGEVVAGAVFVPSPRRAVQPRRAAAAAGWSPRSRRARTGADCGPAALPSRACRSTRRWSATGFGYRAARRKVQGEVVAALLPRVRDIRRVGVASVDLCAVAAGRLDGFYERGLNYWDYAAGALIAAEAGAVVGGLHGAPPSTSMTVAAGPGLFPAALAAWRRYADLRRRAAAGPGDLVS